MKLAWEYRIHSWLRRKDTRNSTKCSGNSHLSAYHKEIQCVWANLLCWIQHWRTSTINSGMMAAFWADNQIAHTPTLTHTHTQHWRRDSTCFGRNIRKRAGMLKQPKIQDQLAGGIWQKYFLWGWAAYFVNVNAELHGVGEVWPLFVHYWYAGDEKKEQNHGFAKVWARIGLSVHC